MTTDIIQADCEGKRSEAYLVCVLARFLIREGYRVRLEVPNMGQSADVVASRGRWLTFIEAKMSNWRRAIEQCQGHEMVADYICIAMPSPLSRMCLQTIRGTGYGLIRCDLTSQRCAWMRLPRRDRNVWAPQRRVLAAAMRSIEYVK